METGIDGSVHESRDEVNINVLERESDVETHSSSFCILKSANTTIPDKRAFHSKEDGINAFMDRVNGVCEDVDVSDSSLTLAANRSLDMSRSLTDKCMKMVDLKAANSEKETSLSAGDRWTKDGKTTPKKRRSLSVVKSSPFTSRKEVDCDFTNDDAMTVNPKLVLRYRIVEEILETERKYCYCLWLLFGHFEESFRQSRLVTEHDIGVIFPPCLKSIYDCHSKFFHKLECRLSQWTKLSTIGDLCSSMIHATNCDLLTNYQTYVSHFPNSLLHLRKICQQDSFLHQYVRDLEGENCCEGLDIGAYLLTPIQRIPRYVLLLKQLLRSTDTNHPDFIPIDSCLLKLREFLNRLNESIERSIELVSISSSIPKEKRFNLINFSFRMNRNPGQRILVPRRRKYSPHKRMCASSEETFLDSMKPNKIEKLMSEKEFEEDEETSKRGFSSNDTKSVFKNVAFDQLTSTPIVFRTPQISKHQTHHGFSLPFKNFGKLKRKTTNEAGDGDICPSVFNQNKILPGRSSSEDEDHGKKGDNHEHFINEEFEETTNANHMVDSFVGLGVESDDVVDRSVCRPIRIDATESSLCVAEISLEVKFPAPIFETERFHRTEPAVRPLNLRPTTTTTTPLANCNVSKFSLGSMNDDSDESSIAMGTTSPSSLAAGSFRFSKRKTKLKRSAGVKEIENKMAGGIKRRATVRDVFRNIFVKKRDH